MVKIITEPTIEGGSEEGVEVGMPRRGKPDKMTILRTTAMMNRGIRQVDLARKWRRSQAFVSQLLRGKVRSEKYERKFAKLVRVAHCRLFPPINGRGRPPAA